MDRKISMAHTYIHTRMKMNGRTNINRKKSLYPNITNSPVESNKFPVVTPNIVTLMELPDAAAWLGPSTVGVIGTDTGKGVGGPA